FIAAARKGRYGLFIELKRDGEKLYKRDGGFKDEHIKEQAAMLHRLYVSGYETFFAIGFEQAKKFIDDYLMT
ncbi:MAG TPA: hypothetical protein VFU62_09290, partial [Hanamia sp.]|nr:hypothetical protein [Hanamia sp.]